MCGRYAVDIDLGFFLPLIPGLVIDAESVARYNVAPSQQVLAILNESPPRLTNLRWGLVPFFATDPKIGDRMINARAETVAEKPSFRAAVKRRRCLIPASGFYEWQKTAAKGPKTPWYFRMKDGSPFAFGGLWEINTKCGPERIVSCTIITTTANDVLAPVHDRMPVIVPTERYMEWLNPEEQDSADVKDFLVPFDASKMTAHTVSTAVNRPGNEGESLIREA